MKKSCNNDKIRRSFSEFLTCECDVPGDLTSGGCYVELRGRNCVRVRGCRRIISYSPLRVLLKMKKDVICVRGKKLTCLTYFAGAISVEGIIDSVSFLHGAEADTE